MPKRRVRGQLLAQCAGHEQISRVGDKFHDSNLEKAGAGGDQREACEFTRRGVDEHTGQHGLKRSKTGVFRGDAQSKRHGKVTERDGNTIGQSLPIPGLV